MSGFSSLSQKILDIELEDINKLLLKKRLEASRRFGIFYMEVFQALMEATKKNVAICQKKTLQMSIKERAAFSEPLYKIVTELTKRGTVKLNVTNTGGIFVDREVGFVNCSKENGDDGLNTSNSVRKHEKLNCKICNHKLDPIYVHNLQKYLEFKIANPTYRDDEEEGKQQQQKRR